MTSSPAVAIPLPSRGGECHPEKNIQVKCYVIAKLDSQAVLERYVYCLALQNTGVRRYVVCEPDVTADD